MKVAHVHVTAVHTLYTMLQGLPSKHKKDSNDPMTVVEVLTSGGRSAAAQKEVEVNKGELRSLQQQQYERRNE